MIEMFVTFLNGRKSSTEANRKMISNELDTVTAVTGGCTYIL